VLANIKITPLDVSLIIVSGEPQISEQTRACFAQCRAACEALGRRASDLLFKEWEEESSYYSSS
jgi:enamine deaminase RidA (YjgF/YER057c/UK114 family)